MIGPLPPHAQLFDAFPAGLHNALLDWALANEHRFAAAKITSGRDGADGRIDPGFRIAATLRDLGPCEPEVREHMLAHLPRLLSATGTSGPQPVSLELELAAHGDGAHYEAHLDVPVGPGRVAVGAGAHEDRVLSAVYYFHRRPQRFEGGALRLYRFGANPQAMPIADGDWIDLEPIDNSLVAFPSWAVHAVRPVSCPTRAFADSRFALNCWFCREL